MQKNSLLFIYNELLSPSKYEKLKLPLEFISFGMVDAKMYKHFRSENVFIIPQGESKEWGNTKVYGALFLCKDYDFYINLLDAYHACSMDKLRYNHIKDIGHRTNIKVTQIYFNTIDELSRLKYKEGNKVEATTYIGNKNHPKIKQRFVTTKSYRVVDGIDKQNYKDIFRRVKEHEERYK